MTIPVLTLSEMKEVESKTTEQSGLSEYDMITSAGEAVFQTIRTLLEEREEEEEFDEEQEDLDSELDSLSETDIIGNPVPKDVVIAFVCGKGHNGADALSAAFLASQSGYPIVLYQIHSETGYSPEVEKLQKQLADNDLRINFIKSPLDLPVFSDITVIVDGLLGSGSRNEPEGLLQSCIFGMNQSKVPILSIDIPSGIGCDAPLLPATAVRAHATICLGGLKLSAAFYPATANYGKVGYSPICFEEKLLRSRPSQSFLYTIDDALADLPKRQYHAHKHSVGKVVVFAGSKGMHGAALMCAKSALRAGAGMVKMVVPAGIYPDLSGQMIEIIGLPVGEKGNDNTFQPDHVEEAAELIAWADAFVVGPGMGRSDPARAFLKKLMSLLSGRKVVLDGDGLMYVNEEMLTGSGLDIAHWLATPHGGEYARMGGKYDYENPIGLIENVRSMVKTKGLSVLLKGPTTLYGCLDGKVLLLPVGNPGMATAGAGDVLAGILGAFLAVMPVEKAAPLGAFAHGKSGDTARKETGMLGLVATDLIAALPLALRELEEESENLLG